MTAGTIPPGSGDSRSGPARGSRSGKKRGRPGRRGRRGRKKKGRLKCGDSGSYGDLQKKYADGHERDHIPSCACLIKNAEGMMAPVELCDAQKAAIRRAASACAIPTGVHAAYSETFRGRNTRKQVAGDAKNKKKAANRDTKAIQKGLRKSGASKECKKKYGAWAKQVNGRTQRWYETMMKKAINK